ncbi:MAG: ABC transporter permease [Xanthobacteraceae bacterium]|nr:ABC transporter permease [Xanthobacteraceae bacterium]MBV9630968.1 ABC transporter permease [Xanthobacteraceae bacterium]
MTVSSPPGSFASPDLRHVATRSRPGVLAALTWKRVRPRFWPVAQFLLPAAFPLAILIAWQVTTANNWLPVQILPTPATVLSTFWDLVTGGDIVVNLQISFWRISLGLAVGGLAGLAFGTVLGVSRAADEMLGPLFKALAQVPSLGWVPILILIFGLDEMLKIIIIAKACFVPIVLATSEGIRNVPRPYREVAQVLRLRRRSVLTKLLIPAALPTVFGGIRLALSHAWIALIVVEMLAAAEGVGYMMVWGRTLFQIDIVIVGMLIIGGIGLLMDAGLARIERGMRRWEPARA